MVLKNNVVNYRIISKEFIIAKVFKTTINNLFVDSCLFFDNCLISISLQLSQHVFLEGSKLTVSNWILRNNYEYTNKGWLRRSMSFTHSIAKPLTQMTNFDNGKGQVRTRRNTRWPACMVCVLHQHLRGFWDLSGVWRELNWTLFCFWSLSPIMSFFS